MGYLRAELDFAAIDKIDVLNKLRRFTMVGTIEVDFPKCSSYSTLTYVYPRKKKCDRPVCHAWLSRSSVTFRLTVAGKLRLHIALSGRLTC